MKIVTEQLAGIIVTVVLRIEAKDACNVLGGRSVASRHGKWLANMASS